MNQDNQTCFPLYVKLPWFYFVQSKNKTTGFVSTLKFTWYLKQKAHVQERQD